MKKVLLLLLSFSLMQAGWTQVKSTFKNVNRVDKIYPLEGMPKFDFSMFNGLPEAQDPFQGLHYSPDDFQPTSFNAVLKAGFRVKKDPASGLPIMIEGKLTDANRPVDGKVTWKRKANQYLDQLQHIMKIKDPGKEFEIVSVNTDDLGHTHIRMQQYFGELAVFGGDLILHAKDNSIYLLNGRYYPTPELDSKTAGLEQSKAVALALQDVAKYTNVIDIPKNLRQFVAGEQTKAQLVVYHEKMNPDNEKLVWKIQLIPNLTDRWSYFVDAQTGDILDRYNQTCRFFHDIEGSCSHHASAPKEGSTPKPLKENLFDGPVTATVQDLNGNNRTINTYEIGNNYILLDVSKPMFNPGGSMIPQEVKGGIMTLDAGNTSPQNDNFEANYVSTNNNNNWDPNGVSAHFNADVSYEYFRTTFNRNSINGEGGTVYSVINVTDENNEQMDNAFWNGIAMFYGNGKQAFSPFAGALDVGGHEMSHGVIQSTSNLEYITQSGALNESFADVFGAMIEREDWRLAEDIVNPQFFTSGAMRDMSNPNNGGSGPNDFRWQPKDMNEFQVLDPTPEQDNGGVHINSGIPNRAYYLFATEVGIEKAEQVWYRTLTRYLTRTSQFIDMRLAVLQAAEDLHGANSAEVNAARMAFNTVGITEGQGTQEPEPVETNTGQELLLFSDEDNTSIFLFSTIGDPIVNPFQNIPGPLRPPSVTDDGSFVLYVANDNTIWAIGLDWANGTVDAAQINDQPIWGNVSISKDGSRFAATTNDQRSSIFVGDLNTGTTREFELYNPTYTQGVSTGDVVFADVLQWDFTGEWIMYDALNRLSTLFDDIEYWDIGFLNVWNNQTNDFGEGFIQKLFSSLGEGLSVGNPTFSKNSPNIVALDIYDEVNDTYYVYGVNTQTGDQSTIFNNLKLGVPNYSLDDSYLIFDAFDASTDESIIAAVNLNEDKITAAGDPIIFFSNPGSFGLKWGIIFGNGIRNFNPPTNTNEATAAELGLNVFPNPVADQFTLEMDLSRTTELELEIYDLLGRRVKALDLGARTGNIQENVVVQDLAPATYLLRLRVGQKVVTTKFVKK